MKRGRYGVGIGTFMLGALLSLSARAQTYPLTVRSAHADVVVAVEPPIAGSRQIAKTSTPRELATADFDGDGDLDIAVTGGAFHTVNWRENLFGDGSWWSRHDVGTGFTGARGIAAADLDGDGDPDLIATAQLGDRVAWWENLNGDGALWDEHMIATSFEGAFSVEAADIDGDGDFDVLATAHVAGSTTWWENTDGEGTAWIAHDIEVNNTGANFAAPADVDMDGDTDVLATNSGTDEILWWENVDGVGTTWIRRVVDGNVDGAAWADEADMDGDGDVDLVATGWYSGEVLWYENLDSQGVLWSKHALGDSYEGARAAYAGDIDGDGDFDVLAAARLADEFVWFENLDGSATRWARRVLDGTGPVQYCLFADLDGDGFDDIVSSSDVDHTILWWQNRYNRRHVYAMPTDTHPWEDGAVCAARVETPVLGNGTTQTVVTGWTRTGSEPGTGTGSDTGPFAITGDTTIEFHWERQYWLAAEAVGPGSVDRESAWIPADSNVVLTAIPADAAKRFIGWSGDVPPDQTRANPLVLPMDRTRALTAHFETPVWNLTVSNAYTESTVRSATLYEQRIDLPGADSVGSVWAADVDGDGDQDTVVAYYDYLAGQVVWLENLDGRGGAWATHLVVDDYDRPFAVHAHDLDGDGDIDIVGASPGSDRIDWWENADGRGTEWTMHEIASGVDGARFVEAADMDGDGDADVVGAASEGDTLTWWENTGGGSGWQAHPVATAIRGASTVRAFDMDGDGDPDLVGAAFDDDEISWWENTDGNGASWSEHGVAVSGGIGMRAFDGAQSAQAADLDADGDMDILGVAYRDDELAWWENTAGNGTLWTEHLVAGSLNGARSLFTVDVDNDGDLDIVCAVEIDDTIGWWENVAGDASTWRVHTFATTLDAPSCVVPADFNGDGAIDILASSHLGGAIAWWSNASDETRIYSPPGDTQHVAASTNLVAYHLGANLVHGATQQVATGWVRTGSEPASGPGPRTGTFALTNNAEIVFQWETQYWLELSVTGPGALDQDSAWTVRGTNLTLSAHPDRFVDRFIGWSGDVPPEQAHENPLVLSMDRARTLTAHFETPMWNLTVDNAHARTVVRGATLFGPRHLVADVPRPERVSAADLDGDNDIDVVVAGETLDQIVWQENLDGVGGAWASHLVATNFFGAYAVHACDLDGDGDIDIVGGARDESRVSWWENTDGDGSNWREYDIDTDLYAPSFVDAADMNGDGYLDVLGTGYLARDVVWWENPVTGGVWQVHAVDTEYAGAQSVRPADVDGDGDTDLVGAAWRIDAISWWENIDGGGTTWMQHNLDYQFDGAAAAYPGDVDGDGDVDILGVASDDDQVAWWENLDGRGTLWIEHTIDAGVNGAWDLFAADLDEDGDLDVVVAAWTEGQVTWYENASGDGAEWQDHLVGPHIGGANSVVPCDINGDGAIDILASAYSANAVAWWDNLLDQRQIFQPPSETRALPASPEYVAYPMDREITNGTTQEYAAGWTRTGSDPAIGSGWNTGVFSLTNDAAIAFHWTRRYWLDTDADGPGSVDPADRWIASGMLTTVTAVADAYFFFTGWQGDTQNSTISSNEIQLVMDQPRTLTAGFSPALTTYGVPHWWMAQYGWTNDFSGRVVLDQDADGLWTWQEWIAGTIPASSTSVLSVDAFAPAANGRVALRFAGSADRAYSVQAVSDLATGAWQEVGFAFTETDPIQFGPYLATNAWTILFVEPLPGNALYRLHVAYPDPDIFPPLPPAAIPGLP